MLTNQKNRYMCYSNVHSYINYSLNTELKFRVSKYDKCTIISWDNSARIVTATTQDIWSTGTEPRCVSEDPSLTDLQLVTSTLPCPHHLVDIVPLDTVRKATNLDFHKVTNLNVIDLIIVDCLHTDQESVAVLGVIMPTRCLGYLWMTFP